MVRQSLWTLSPALLAALVFGMVAFHGLRAPIRYRRAVRRTVYALTPRRVIVLNGFGYSKQANLCDIEEPVQTFAGHEIRERKLSRLKRDGSGDIVFGGEWRRGRKNSRHWVEFGLFGVPEVAKVDHLLGQIAGEKGKPVKPTVDVDDLL